MQELGRNGFVPVTFPPNVWALSTILGCLEPKPVSLVGQGGVTVLGTDGTPQSDSGSQLTASDLAAPGSTDFNNPQEAPVVSNLGTAIRYDRPWRGASQGQTDDDYLDQVTESLNGQAQPLTIEVFEGQLLSVTIHTSDTTVQAGSSVSFSATTSGQGASTLAYSWTFDGAAPSSTSPNPQVTFADQGQYNVTVQVTDTAGGGGVASLPITVGTPPAPSTGGHKQKGAGTNKKSHAPTGPKKSGGHHAGGPAGKPKSGQSTTPAKTNTNTTGGTTTQPSTTAQTTPTTTTPTTTTPTTTTPTTTAPTTTGTTPHPSTAPRTPRTHPPAPLTRPSTPVPFAGPRVTGQLISDVTTIPAANSPLVRIVPAAVATAPPARRAIRASLLPAFGAGLAVILLLGLGARRELRTRRAWRTLRFGS
jgi:PKD repeat protein